ncbi:uncharacterized protein LOC131605718 [Vicia villosa]|uniref:uncharacterized protein LOC131605718 n=1 Tax=Vicia villosa TaxID=3911 RepID=UPI00273CE483|nr:uncharacterized protein LOC131605718 [Vicia villosa]
MKKIIKERAVQVNLQHHWEQMNSAGKFSMRKTYQMLMEDNQTVSWHGLMKKNLARPRERITLWLLCHGHLSTKDRLCRFGIIDSSMCSMCGQEEETADHVFFSCIKTAGIWQGVLNWIGSSHSPQPWSIDLQRFLDRTKGKGWRTRLFQLALTETVHEVWLYRNSIVFCKEDTSKNIIDSIIDRIVYRGWKNRKIGLQLANLML